MANARQFMSARTAAWAKSGDAKEIKWAEGRYLNMSGTEVEDPLWAYTEDFFDVNAGASVFFLTFCRFWSSACFCIYDNQKNFSDYFGITQFQRVITISDVASYARGSVISEYKDLAMCYDLTNRKMIYSGKSIVEKGLLDSGKYLNSSGGIVYDQDWCVTDFVRVDPSSVLFWTTGSESGSPKLVQYDANKNVVDYNTNTNYREVNITANTAFIRVSAYTPMLSFFSVIDLTNKSCLLKGAF